MITTATYRFVWRIHCRASIHSYPIRDLLTKIHVHVSCVHEHDTHQCQRALQRGVFHSQIMAGQAFNSDHILWGPGKGGSCGSDPPSKRGAPSHALHPPFGGEQCLHFCAGLFCGFSGEMRAVGSFHRRSLEYPHSSCVPLVKPHVGFQNNYSIFPNTQFMLVPFS